MLLSIKVRSDPKNMKKAIIMGGYGFLGSHIAAEAEKRGWETVRAGRAEYKSLIGSSCDLLINANGNSKKYLAEKDPLAEFDLSVRSVLRSLRDFQPKLYVYLSTIDVYHDKAVPARNHEDAAIEPLKLGAYGLHKYMAENLVKFYAAQWLILRLGGFVGVGLKKNSIYDMLVKEKLRVHPDSRYQYLDASAMAAILFDLAGAEQAGTVFNLAGAGTISLREASKLIPGQPLAGAPLEKQPEIYDVNISRIQKIATIPETRATVERFVKDVLAGRIKLN